MVERKDAGDKEEEKDEEDEDEDEEDEDEDDEDDDKPHENTDPSSVIADVCLQPAATCFALKLAASCMLPRPPAFRSTRNLQTPSLLLPLPPAAAR